MRFAQRSDFGSGETAYGQALREARAHGGLLDLTLSNPTQCGFVYPSAELLAPLGEARVLHYDAGPLGMRSAREAVSRLYRDVYGAEVLAEHLLLTASTSEAYGYLLRLFCDPGDSVLVPSPSYPLFDLLARLHDVELIPYPLVYDHGWQIDPASLKAAIPPRARAIVAVHPNNPTGHYCSPTDRAALYDTARTHDLPLIVDEVFLDYAVEGAGCPTFAKPRWDRGGDDRHRENVPAPLVFVLSGLSKLLALPQMKLAWMAVCGPDRKVSAAMERLEVIADTFLSAGTPAQTALPAWLGVRNAIQRQITKRVLQNVKRLDQAILGTAISRLKVEGGWTAVLRVPAIGPDQELAVRLLREFGVAAHPGSFYGFPQRGWLVVSLLPPPEIFIEGIRRLAGIEFGTPFPQAGPAS